MQAQASIKRKALIKQPKRHCRLQRIKHSLNQLRAGRNVLCKYIIKLDTMPSKQTADLLAVSAVSPRNLEKFNRG